MGRTHTLPGFGRVLCFTGNLRMRIVRYCSESGKCGLKSRKRDGIDGVGVVPGYAVRRVGLGALSKAVGDGVLCTNEPRCKGMKQPDLRFKGQAELRRAVNQGAARGRRGLVCRWCLEAVLPAFSNVRAQQPRDAERPWHNLHN
jgi:hypothetical protein